MDKDHQFFPTAFSFFVKTDEAVHQGGFIFFSVEEFEAARPRLAEEAAHICESNNHKLVSWGLVDSSGKVLKEFKAGR